MSTRTLLSSSSDGFGSLVPPAAVVEGGDGVVELVVAHQMDVSVFVMDEGEEKALHLHEGLTQGVELELARRVDCSHHLGLHIQDNPVCSISLATTQDAELINADLAENWALPRRKFVDFDEAPGLHLFTATPTHPQPFH